MRAVDGAGLCGQDVWNKTINRCFEFMKATATRPATNARRYAAICAV